MTRSIAVLVAVVLAGVAVAAEEPWTVPERSAKKANPVAADDASIAAGKLVYRKECLSCHGPKGKGDGDKAADLETKPGDFSDPAMWQETDGALFWKITTGRKPMPAFEDKLGETDRWHVVNYIRGFAPRPEPAPAPAPQPPGPTGQGDIPGAPHRPGDPSAPERVLLALAADPAAVRMFLAPEEPLAVPPPEPVDTPPSDPGTGPAAPTDRGTEPDAPASPGSSTEELAEQIEDMEQQIGEVRREARAAAPGTLGAVLTGYGSGGAELDLAEKTSVFGVGFSPTMLWKVSRSILFEGELELEVEGGQEGVGVELEYAEGLWVATDWLTIGAGMFLSPVNPFSERSHPTWINKLPDAPLAFGHGGLLPTSDIGVQARGGLPIGRARVGYAVAVSNGPGLTPPGAEEEEEGAEEADDAHAARRSAGHGSTTAEFAPTGKAVGGRIGVLPLSGIEVGVAGEVVAAPESEGAATVVIGRLAGVDASVGARAGPVGRFDVRTQWAWSQLRVDAEDVGSFGGYAQASLRLSGLPAKTLGRLEPVGRFELLTSAEGADEKRVAAGLVYWMAASSATKLAWERSLGGQAPEDRLFGQAVVGF